MTDDEILKNLMHPLDDMSSSLCYYKRITRGHIEVDSSASRARVMKLVADRGKFIGYGDTICSVSEQEN